MCAYEPGLYWTNWRDTLRRVQRELVSDDLKVDRGPDGACPSRISKFALVMPRCPGPAADEERIIVRHFRSASWWLENVTSFPLENPREQ